MLEIEPEKPRALRGPDIVDSQHKKKAAEAGKSAGGQGGVLSSLLLVVLLVAELGLWIKVCAWRESEVGEK